MNRVRYLYTEEGASSSLVQPQGAEVRQLLCQQACSWMNLHRSWQGTLHLTPF